EEHRLVVGEEVFSRVKIENHDCQAGDLVHLGYTSRGTEITINRTVYDSERVILTGGISYHLLAGFGGGRKSIAPGVCGYDSIQQNHGLALKDVDSSGINPGVVPGVLKGNPVSEDMFEIAEAVKPDFLINVVVNEKKEVIAVVAGDIYEAFEAGCKIVEKAFGIQVHGQSDVVISSCGGYPKDIQLYQSIKGLDNAAYVVKERGVIILASECSDGAGSDDFLSWFKGAGVEEMRAALNKNFTMPGFVALRVAGIMARARVILLSTLPEEVVKGVGMIPAGTPEEAWAKARHIAGEVKNITYMPHGSLTFPIIKP
ncbi:MAG: nickel-dependent lactate racemase, partial [Opitutales bacterium]|nr:nickel-dependent lactate racemase [Opitutales bacterium]